MKTIVVLFAGNVTDNAFLPVSGGMSAWDMSLSWAFSVPDAEKVAVCVSGRYPVAENSLSVKEKTVLIHETDWTVSALLKHMREISSGYDTIVFGWADCPFYDRHVTASLYERHCRYAAEYTFADGYPEGISPELLAPGTASVLSVLAAENCSPVTRGSLFSVLQADINSFEIETEIAPCDLRYLRVLLACDTKRNTLQCRRLSSHLERNGTDTSAAQICAVLERCPGVLRTLPAFYSIQISGRCPGECTFCPYPSMSLRMSGTPAVQRGDFMDIERFSSLVGRILEFSGDAGVNLSLWGEPVLHPHFPQFVETVLEYPSLSVLVETTGQGLTAETVKAVAGIVSRAGKRTNGQQPVNWIVGLDAVQEQIYGSLHGMDLTQKAGADSFFSAAVQSVETLLAYFPGAVYPQFLRMKENEDAMEQFYRLWKEKAGHVIIQKYDWFCKMLEDKKVADLSPVRRNPCWHLRRDMSILIDGTVPLCREDIYCSKLSGNAFDDSLEEIWAAGDGLFAAQLDGRYEGICGNCDEYYTYNF